MTKEQILGILRHTLTFAGGILLMKGIIDESTWTEISGSALTLIGAIWSVIDKNKKLAKFNIESEKEHQNRNIKDGVKQGIIK